MMSSPSSFEDPHEDAPLKSAIRGVAGEHRASAALREKVTRALAIEAIDLPKRPGTGRQLVGAKRWLAMAAVIAIGVSGVLIFNEWYSTSQWARSSSTRGAAPTIWQAMASLEDGHCIEAESPIAPLTDSKTIAAEASTKFHRRVPAPSFAGWTLSGASYCTVGGHEAVRFRFTSGTRTAGVISLPQSAYGYQASDSYSIEAEGRQIAGFVKDGGLHCVVGDRQMSLADVQALVDQLRTQ